MRARLSILLLCVCLVASGLPVPVTASRSIQVDEPSIRISKKMCNGRTSLPVFVESHCADVPGASFEFGDPDDIGSLTIEAGETYTPAINDPSGSNLWRLDDHAAGNGSRVVSCLGSVPGSTWNSTVTSVVHTEEPGQVLIDWGLEGTGTDGEPYVPSLDCVWLELPDLDVTPGILNLQAFTTDIAYLNWSEATGPALPDADRGESGEDLEADLVMTNVNSNEVYTFAADAHGQVLVPPGTYSLMEETSGTEVYFSIVAAQTILVEVGLGESGAGGAPYAVETFATGVIVCDGTDCTGLPGVTIAYVSANGEVEGSCVTEIVETPNGEGAWCDYQYVPGLPTTLTVDESTLPDGVTLISDNPMTYLVPVNPDGVMGPAYFQAAPA